MASSSKYSGKKTEIQDARKKALSSRSSAYPVQKRQKRIEEDISSSTDEEETIKSTPDRRTRSKIDEIKTDITSIESGNLTRTRVNQPHKLTLSESELDIEDITLDDPQTPNTVLSSGNFFSKIIKSSGEVCSYVQSFISQTDNKPKDNDNYFQYDETSRESFQFSDESNAGEGSSKMSAIGQLQTSSQFSNAEKEMPHLCISAVINEHRDDSKAKRNISKSKLSLERDDNAIDEMDELSLSSSLSANASSFERAQGEEVSEFSDDSIDRLRESTDFSDDTHDSEVTQHMRKPSLSKPLRILTRFSKSPQPSLRRISSSGHLNYARGKVISASPFQEFMRRSSLASYIPYFPSDMTLGLYR